MVESASEAQGRRQPQINCSYTVGPITIPGVGSFEAFGTVTGFVTPG